METTPSLPAIDRCIALYLTADRHFGDTPFSTESIADHVTTSESSDFGLEQHLSLLVAYGLVEHADDGRYQIRCSPDDSLATWQERATSRAETLRRLVTAAKDNDRTTTDSRTESLEYDGDSFASISVTDQDDVNSVAAMVASAFDSDDPVAGVVLRSAGDAAGNVQQIADSLCNPDDPIGVPSLEKEYTDLVGEQKDTLEFRLFLRATRA